MTSVARNFLSKKTELLQNNGKTDILPQNNGKTDFLAEKNGKRTKFRSSKKRTSFFGTSSGNTVLLPAVVMKDIAAIIKFLGDNHFN